MQPCEQKDTIDAIKKDQTVDRGMIHEMRVTQVKIEADVAHVKSRIDNGMSATLKEIKDYFLEFKGTVKHHEDVINRLEDIGWWAVKIGLAGAVVGGIVWLSANGWKP